MAEDFYVYVYKNHTGKPLYVGKGRGNRCKEHISLAKAINDGRRLERRTPFTNWLAKQLRDGKDFSCAIIVSGLSEKQAYEAEVAAIKQFGRVKIDAGGTLLNRLKGGDGINSEDAKRLKSTPEARANASKATKLALSDPETRKRMSAATKVSNGRPERRAQSREKAMTEWAKPARRIAAANRAKELWSDPVWSAQRRAELVDRNKSKKVSKQ